MKLLYSQSALRALSDLPVRIRKALYKQAAFLVQDLHHPSLHAKKYSETEDKWQARINRNWRFYFKPLKLNPLPHSRSDGTILPYLSGKFLRGIADCFYIHGFVPKIVHCAGPFSEGRVLEFVAL